MKMVRFLLVVVGSLLLHGYCQCQVKNDTIPSFIKGKPVTGARVVDTLPRGPHSKGHKEKPYPVDSLAKKKHNPRKATLYSTFFPGLGQIYNRKYWKLPLVYAAVGIPAYTFFSNHSLYSQCQQAIALIDPYTSIGAAVPDSVSGKISNSALRYLASQGEATAIRTYRNQYRQYQDYSVLFFLLFWGLQIVDATVDAHLMNFDVSDQLSLHLQQPSVAPGATTGMIGLGLGFDLHKPHSRPLNVLP
jgi:hypothetical protein